MKKFDLPNISKESKMGRTDSAVRTKTSENFDNYIRKDARVKCALCRRFMRYNPTAKTPARRRLPPNAGTCTECPIMKVNGSIVRLIHEELNYN